MSWLADRLGIHLNLRPLAAPAGYFAGGLLGGPAGAAIGAGVAKTADNKLHGDSWGHSLGQGALNAGIYGLGGPALDKLRGAFTGGGSAAGSFVPSSAVDMGVSPLGGGSGAAGSFVTPATEGGGGSFLDSLGSGLKKAGSWVGEHPGAVSGALQGAGQIGQMGSENALRKAQTTSLDVNNQQNQYELEAKRRRDAALAPLLAAFQGQLQNQFAHPPQIARNPYAGS